MMKNSIIGGESSGRQLDGLVGHSGFFSLAWNTPANPAGPSPLAINSR
jgi:hypothetical protein